MKIILSRKGFDKENGGMPSPIMPDGTLLSLPIPQKNDPNKFSRLIYGNKSYLDIIQELKPNTEISQNNEECHLDPDLRKGLLQRERGWLPLFGQANAAETHLRNSGVTKGDLFLFFGWFRNTTEVNGKLEFVKNKATDVHIIYGYLQVGQKFEGYDEVFKLPKQFEYHPHYMNNRKESPNNSIYVASNSLSFLPSKGGAGCFKYHDRLVLTKKGSTRSKWLLPEYFKKVKITYHSNHSWKNDYFQSAAKGQEFVIEANRKVENWAKELITIGSK